MNTKLLNVLLWIGQVLIGLMFLFAGGMKTFQPIETLAQSLPWVLETPSGLIRLIGISELLGGTGIILPSLFRIRPKLTVLAALGIIVIMILAFIFHISRGEFQAIGINIFIALIAGFIAWGRNNKLPIPPKST